MIGFLPQPVEVRHKLPPLRALTAIRFFAAIHVVLFHESHWDGHIPLGPIGSRIVNSGYTAVTLFFVLSGFILAYNYERVSDRAEFWISRFARIYPIYFLSLLPSLASPHFSYHPHPGALGTLLTFTLLQGWAPSLAFSLNLAAWTLSVEAFFYAIFPFLLPWSERLRLRTFLALQAAYLPLTCLPPLLALHPSTHTAGVWIASYWESTLPFVRLNSFFLGVFAGAWFRCRVSRRGACPVLSGATRAACLLALGSGIAFLLWLQPTVTFGPLRTEALQLCYALLILLLADVNWKALVSHPIQMAGEISYGIYVLQFPVLFLYNDVLHRLFPHRAHISILYIAALCLVSWATFRWIEVPARLFIRRKLTGRAVPVRAI
jgi:peptidoglycan/LPS O-acetylase OafA/YrhL